MSNDKGLPPNHPCDFRILLKIHHPASLGYPQAHDYGNPNMDSTVGIYDASKPQSIEGSPKKCSWACAKMMESKQSIAKMVGKRMIHWWNQVSRFSPRFQTFCHLEIGAQNGAIFTPICSHFSSRMGATKQGSV